MPTATTNLDQHVTLQYRSLDRLFLDGYVPLLQSPGGVARFLERDGPLPSPAARISCAVCESADQQSAETPVIAGSDRSTVLVG